MTSKIVTLTEESDIVDADGDIVALNLRPGTYAIPAGVNTTLTARSAAGSKAGLPTRMISFPSAKKYATLLAEDVFPSKGDYDMNDLVAGFRVNCIVDEVYNEIRQIQIIVVPRAAGSSYDRIGLAARLTHAFYYLVRSVVRDDNGSPGELFTVDDRLVETNTGAYAVIPLTGDFRNHFRPRQHGMLNTYAHLPYFQGESFSVTITLDKGIGADNFELFGNDPTKVCLDLFAVFGDRGKEVHLKGQRPTAKFDSGKYFSTLTDFVTPDNYVWMIVADKSIFHPTELTNIASAYPDFAAWVQSDGNLGYNWYDNYEQSRVYPYDE